jgi:uncharacterized protein (TIGR02246 family)
MKSALPLFVCSLLSAWSLSARLCAEEAAAPPAHDAVAAIGAALGEYVDAFNQRDVDALKARWRPEGEFFDIASGAQTMGREAIANNFRVLFSGHDNLSLSGRIESVRFIRPEVAQVTGVTMTVGAGDEPLASNFTAILVRDGERWLFDSIHETPLPAVVAGRRAEPLESLEFLVGRWVDDNQDARVTTIYRWGANRSFLVRSYTVDRGDDQLVQGTQVIGWDPREQQIRCWTFDSNGSFGEGVWSASEDGWKLKLTQTLADGRVAGATQVITRVDENTLLVHLVGQEIDGETLPSTEAVRVVRAGGRDEN